MELHHSNRACRSQGHFRAAPCPCCGILFRPFHLRGRPALRLAPPRMPNSLRHCGGVFRQKSPVPAQQNARAS
eukprot:1511466-Pyramimonas_sp.AAC.1